MFVKQAIAKGKAKKALAEKSIGKDKMGTMKLINKLNRTAQLEMNYLVRAQIQED